MQTQMAQQLNCAVLTLVHTILVLRESIDGSGVLWDHHPVNFVVMMHSFLSTCAYDKRIQGDDGSTHHVSQTKKEN